eukprot:scaffold14495_cov56-Phaeocystis_antarctica.AAC.4
MHRTLRHPAPRHASTRPRSPPGTPHTLTVVSEGQAPPPTTTPFRISRKQEQQEGPLSIGPGRRPSPCRASTCTLCWPPWPPPR